MPRKPVDTPITVPTPPRVPARAIVVGLGPIGLAIARAARSHPLVELVGAVDPAPGRAGRDLGRVLGEDKPMGVIVASEIEEALRRSRPRLCFLATSSHLTEVEEDLLTLIGHGCSVVTTAEELANPVLHDEALSEKLDEACRRSGVVVVGAGVNPGFVLDRLVLTLCQVARDISRVECIRVIDANDRRPQLLTKMGGGMSPTLFAELALQSGVGLVGLRDSMHLVARALGWQLSDYRESIVPVVAKETINTPVGVLERGQIRGATQRARGIVDGVERISYHLEIAADSNEPRDEIRIHGTPPVHMVIPGGLPGDEATVSATMATVSFALFGRPGLRLPTEMPPDPRALAGIIPPAAASKPRTQKKKARSRPAAARKKTAPRKTARRNARTA